jgi:hypothetical protein
MKKQMQVLVLAKKSMQEDLGDLQLVMKSQNIQDQRSLVSSQGQ